jgi:cytidylate kinase
MVKIAIDGPAGAGKSTIAQRIAKLLKFVYVDTGAMYRAVTYKTMGLGLNLEDPVSYDFLKKTTISFKRGHVFIDGVDVSKEIRNVDVTENVSTPSKIPLVREYLVGIQRKISNKNNIVMDGRDIGTVVLPDADLKIFLDASASERAKRRMIEWQEKGIYKTVEEIQKEIEIRDLKDSTRDLSPLKKADDAIVIDTSNLSIDEVIEKIVLLINERGLFKMSNVKFTEGQEVVGTITNVTKDAVYLIVDETKAVIYSNDIEGYNESQKLRDQYNEGGELKALVKQIAKDRKTGETLYILSTKLYSVREKLPLFDELRESEDIIAAKVVRVEDRGAYRT